jgi:hypothetical protein
MLNTKTYWLTVTRKVTSTSTKTYWPSVVTWPQTSDLYSDHWQIALKEGASRRRAMQFSDKKKGKSKIWSWAPRGCPTPRHTDWLAVSHKVTSAPEKFMAFIELLDYWKPELTSSWFHSGSRFVVVKALKQFGIPEKGEYPPLEAVTRGLVKVQKTEVSVRTIVNCRMHELPIVPHWLVFKSWKCQTNPVTNPSPRSRVRNCLHVTICLCALSYGDIPEEIWFSTQFPFEMYCF